MDIKGKYGGPQLVNRPVERENTEILRNKRAFTRVKYTITLIFTFRRRINPLRKGEHRLSSSRLWWGTSCPKDSVACLGSWEILLPEVILRKRLHLASPLQRHPAMALPLVIRRSQRLLHPEMGRRLRSPCMVQNRLVPRIFPLHRCLSRPAWIRLQRLRLLLLQWLSASDHRLYVCLTSRISLTRPWTHQFECEWLRVPQCRKESNHTLHCATTILQCQSLTCKLSVSCSRLLRGLGCESNEVNFYI